MNYRFVITDEALAGVEKWLDYVTIERESPLNAERWWRRALAEIMALERMPNRHPFASENDHRPYEIRALVVDNCIFLFHVDEMARIVRVIGFRHGSQLPMPDDLPQDMPQ